MDRFKIINDRLGHGIGDQFLKVVSERLEATVRPGDTVARLGGDEFVVLLEDLETIQDARVIADRLIDMFKNPIVISQETIHLTASIGITLVSPDFPTIDVIMRNADLAMYQAKAHGRNRCAVFSYEQHIRRE